MNLRQLLPILALPLLAAAPASAQTVPRGDVEMLGERYGTTPPAAYYEMLEQRPDAFTFSRAWKARNPHLRRLDAPGPAGAPRFEVVGGPGPGALARGPAALGPREEPVTGTVRLPLVLGLFSDTPTPPYGRDEIQREFFDGPSSRYGTVEDYYAEVSGGLLELQGETVDWRASGLTEAQVAGGSSGLGGGSRVWQYIFQVLSALEGQVDWGAFDNDGPDGVPNSGDDDGVVDILAVMHPSTGAECGGAGQDDRIWSHKWTLSQWTGDPYVTGSDAAGGGKIRIDDYAIQPVLDCSGGPMNEIGVLTHELGHAFGLPDLYDTRNTGRHNGIGGWGLMGSGSYGCDQHSAERPCHMSAWSKAQLGWVEQLPLATDTDLGTMSFEPVVTSGKVYRVETTDGSGEYYLLENRQEQGFDQRLIEPGLLVWHIDAEAVAARWLSNTVNARNRMGVYLIQADGDEDLAKRNGGNRGDRGDPFPGSTGNSEFHAGSDPAASTWGGEASGLTLTAIGPGAGDAMVADVSTRLTRITLEAAGEPAEGVVFAVDGAPVGPSTAFQAAPFEVLEIEAGAGPTIEDGVRVGFVGWEDDLSLGRTRTFETPREDRTLVARYGGEEVRARFTVEGGRFGVPPGEVTMSPEPREEFDGLWFPRHAEVTFQAAASTGYAFLGWSGVLEGFANPTTYTVSDPVDMGAVFELTYGVEAGTHEFEAAREQEIVLVAENGDDPVQWARIGGDPLPRGLTLSESGVITGAALETGTFAVRVSAQDAKGLYATGDVVLEVLEPTFGVQALAAPFILTGGSLTSTEQAFLDARGNDDGVYDLGDFRAWVLDHPTLPATVEDRALIRTLVPVFRFVPGGGS